MLMPNGLTSSERKKYVEDNKWRLAKGSPRVQVNKHPGLRVVDPSKAQAAKQKVEAKEHVASASK